MFLFGIITILFITKPINTNYLSYYEIERQNIFINLIINIIRFIAVIIINIVLILSIILFNNILNTGLIKIIFFYNIRCYHIDITLSK